jgi:uncharacterized membrane protein YebE (DUF533 family)
MFDAERLLGSLLNAALSRGFRAKRDLKWQQARGIKGLAGEFLNENKATIGMGLLGVAIAAYEHFSQKAQSVPVSAGTVPSPVAPMPKPLGSPPPLPNWSPPPLPSQADQWVANHKDDAVVLIRAMIAAAHSDKNIDDQEHLNILKTMEESGCSPEEREFLLREAGNPLQLNGLLDLIKSPQLAEQVYVVSLMAIQPDSHAELDYLRQLAQGLGLSEDVVSKWNKDLGV